MSFKEFTQIFSESFDEQPTDLNEQTKYKELDDWTSMQALILIAHLDDTVNVVLSASDIKDSSTLSELHQIVSSKL